MINLFIRKNTALHSTQKLIFMDQNRIFKISSLTSHSSRKDVPKNIFFKIRRVLSKINAKVFVFINPQLSGIGRTLI